MRLHVVEGYNLSSVGVQGGLGTKHISIFVYCAGERLKKERIRRIQQFLEKLSKENEEEAEDTVEEIFANLVRFIDSSQQTFQAGGLQPKKEEQTGTERQDSRRKSPGPGRKYPKQNLRKPRTKKYSRKTRRKFGTGEKSAKKSVFRQNSEASGRTLQRSRRREARSPLSTRPTTTTSRLCSRRNRQPPRSYASGRSY